MSGDVSGLGVEGECGVDSLVIGGGGGGITTVGGVGKGLSEFVGLVSTTCASDAAADGARFTKKVANCGSCITVKSNRFCFAIAAIRVFGVTPTMARPLISAMRSPMRRPELSFRIKTYRNCALCVKESMFII